MLGSKQLRIYRAVSVTREPTLRSALHDTRFSARDLALDSLLASLSRIFPNSCVSFSVVIFLSVSTLMSLMSCVSLPVFLCSFSMSVNSSSGNPKLIFVLETFVLALRISSLWRWWWLVWDFTYPFSSNILSPFVVIVISIISGAPVVLPPSPTTTFPNF